VVISHDSWSFAEVDHGLLDAPRYTREATPGWAGFFVFAEIPFRSQKLRF